MNTDNFLKDIQQKRSNFKAYTQKALDNNWITQEQFDEFLHKIENDKLVIGVIGQMKAGKSTFLNALIFKDEVLPAATTPMTASLSVLTYGEEKKLEAEFYTSQEWNELKQFASLDESNYENDNNQQSKIKAAKEIIAKSVTIGSEINIILGTKKTDAFENLIEYVGADGKYIAITKSVRIEYPMEDLKGVEIVDTPGFNDPVVSREERTKDFLKKADVVIMLLYAGRAFDATDKDIIFNKVRSVGVGKLLIGVNKYDINYAQGETNEAMVAYVKEQLLKASEEYTNNSIATLVKEQHPLLLSANMALMSKLDMTKISQDKDLDFYYKKALDNFEITTQKEMYEKSLMPAFEEAIREIILKSKDEILIQKPVNLIKQIGENKLEELLKDKTQSDNELVILKKPDTDLDELLANTERAKKRIDRKIAGLEIDVKEIISKSIRKLTDDTEDALFDAKKKCKAIVDDNAFVIRTDKLDKKIEGKLETTEHNINKIFKKSNDKINSNLKMLTESFISEIEEVAEKFLEDFDYNDYIRSFKKHFSNDVVSIRLNDLFQEIDNVEEASSLIEAGGIFLYHLVNGASWGTVQGVINVATAKSNAKEVIDNFFSLIDLNHIKEQISKSGTALIEDITKDISNDFVQPIIDTTEELIKNKDNRELQIKGLEDKLEILKTNETVLKSQIEEMKVLEGII